MNEPSTCTPGMQHHDFWPVLTLDGRTIDRMLLPFLSRLGVAGVMMSMHYASLMDRRALPNLPVFVDSGGFAVPCWRAKGGSSATPRLGIWSSPPRKQARRIG